MIPPFKIEEFFKKHEFSAPYLLCSSDAESWDLNEILEMADPESKKLWQNLRLGYTEVLGLPLLREEIASLYPSLKSDHVMTVTGGEEGIYCTMRTLLTPGDHVIIIKPCYQSLETIARAAGADVTAIHLDPKKKWKLQLDDLKQAFRPNTKLLIINYPHNPTGTLLDKEVFYGVIELVSKRGTYVFSDEMYRLFEIDEKKRLPSFADAYERAIVLFGMAKPFGLAGLRAGWLASPDEDIIQKICSYKLYTSICSSAPSEILALIGLRAKEKILARNRKIMLDNLVILDRFFERHPSLISWVRPESGSISFPELILPVPIEKFTEQLVEKTGVLILPGSIFDVSGNFFRLGFGRKNMPDVLERFENFLKNYSLTI